jgi:CheY-like chemotaxis protein
MGSSIMNFFEPTDRPSAESDPRDFDAPPAGVREPASILLVEDEPTLRVLTQRVLSRAGYRVAAAGDAAQALALVAREVGLPDLLVTDLELPGRHGRELAKLLLEQQPTLAVLYISGHGSDLPPLHPAAKSAPRTLAKPFTSEALLEAVRRALARS